MLAAGIHRPVIVHQVSWEFFEEVKVGKKIGFGPKDSKPVSLYELGFSNLLLYFPASIAVITWNVQDINRTQFTIQ